MLCYERGVETVGHLMRQHYHAVVCMRGCQWFASYIRHLESWRILHAVGSTICVSQASQSLTCGEPELQSWAGIYVRCVQKAGLRMVMQQQGRHVPVQGTRVHMADAFLSIRPV